MFKRLILISLILMLVLGNVFATNWNLLQESSSNLITCSVHPITGVMTNPVSVNATTNNIKGLKFDLAHYFSGTTGLNIVGKYVYSDASTSSVYVFVPSTQVSTGTKIMTDSSKFSDPTKTLDRIDFCKTGTGGFGETLSISDIYSTQDDITSPVTTFSYEQISGTTDTNITLTCVDDNSGCKAINYNVNNEGWNNISYPVSWADDLISYYKLDETSGTTLKDVLGSYNLTLNSGTINQTGIIDKAVSFTNANSQYAINTSMLSTPANWTMCGWVYPTGGSELSLAFGNGTGVTGLTIIKSNGAGTGTAGTSISTLQAGVTWDSVKTTTSWTDNAWNFICLTRTGTTYQFYKNGSAITTTGTPTVANSTNFGIGATTTANPAMAGTIDEVGYWSRVLTTDEITELYNSGNGLTYTTEDINNYSFLYSGAGDHNIQYFSTDNADNNESINTSTFSTYGLAKFTFYDENSSLALDNVNFTISPSINGVSSGTDANLDLNLQSITSQEYLFTFSKTGYGTRYYQANLNQFSNIDINFALLDEDLSTNIPFKIYQTDETTIFANTFVELYRPSNGFIIGKNKTNSFGETSFSIHVSDQNYYVNVDDGNYVYQPVALTILYPKNEITLVQIPENWRIDITQNLYESFTDLNATKVIYLLPNTSLPFNIRIQDMNGNYFARTYAKQYPGNPLTDTLQPYLIPIDTGLLTTITTKSSLTNQIVPNITIKIYKFISGTGRTLVEQVITDDKGQALILLQLNSEYEFETYSDAEFIKTFTITATSSQIFLMLPIESDFEPTEPSGFTATFTPNNTGITKINVGNAVFTQTINNFGSISYTVTSQIIQNGVVLSTETYSASTLASRTLTRTVTWTDINKGELISRVTITTSAGTFSFEQKYFINDAFGTNYNLFTGLSQGLRSDFACPATGVCWTLLVLGLIISIAIGIYASSILNNISGQAIAIITILPLTLFAYLTWVPFELVIAIIIIVGAFIINERRG